MSRHRPDAEEAANLQYETEHTRPGRGQSVTPYLILLVAVAFVLLVVAFLMQERSNQAVAGLNQSANSLHTIDQLVEENRELREETIKLQSDLADSQEKNRAVSEELAQVRQELAALQGQLSSPEPSPSAAP